MRLYIIYQTCRTPQCIIDAGGCYSHSADAADDVAEADMAHGHAAVRHNLQTFQKARTAVLASPYA